MVAFSILIVALADWATLAIMPPGRQAVLDQAREYRAQGDISTWRARGAPIFVFDGELFPEQCGKARIETEQTVLMEVYRDARCRQAAATATEPALFLASPRLLWAMVPQSERATLEDRSRQLVDSLGSSLAGTLRTAHFEREYRADVTDILRTALRRAWESPEVKASLAVAMQSVDPLIVDRLVEGILPVALEKAESTLWETVRGMTGTIFGQRNPVGEGSPMARALRAIFEDQRVQEHLLQTLPEFASDPEFSILATRFASEVGLALINDPRVPVLLTTLLTDPKMARPEAGRGIGGKFLTQEIPRWLLRYRHPRDHNPMVAFVVRSLLRGDGAYVVLLLTEEQAALVAGQGLRGGIALSEVRS